MRLRDLYRLADLLGVLYEEEPDSDSVRSEIAAVRYRVLELTDERERAS